MPRKIWRGLRVDESLKDEWLDRLFAIPGIAIASLDPTGFTLTPYPRLRKIEPAFSQDLEDAYSGVARVVSDNTGAYPVYHLFAEEFTPGWWETVIERLQEFASRRPHTDPTIEDFEKDILLGASEVFAFKRKMLPPRERYTNPWSPSTPMSEEEATRFLEAMADLNQSSVYDLYLNDLDTTGGIDTPLHRWWFGTESAMRGLGLWFRGGEPDPLRYKVPVWWSVAPGSFDICVLKQPYRIPEGDYAYSVLIGHPESGTAARVYMNPRALVLSEFLTFGGCEEAASFSEEAAAWKRYAAAPGSKLVCEAMPGDDILDFIASFFPKWDRARALAAMELVLANCFARE